MKAKLWVPVALVLVAVLAFVGGWWYRNQEALEVEPVAASEPAPVPVATQQPAPAAPASRPVRRAASSTPAAPITSEPEPAAPVETASLSPVAAAPAPTPHTARVAEGTKIRFTLNQSLSTKTAREGDDFSGVVSRSVRQGDQVVIPEGSVIRGRVSHVQRPGRVKGRGELGLRFDELELPDGETYDLSASLTSLEEGEKESVDEEGQVKSEGSKKRDAATIGAGAGIGAIIGAIAGGGKGAAIGAGGGAAAGTGLVLLTRGKDVELKRGSELAIQLDRPLNVTTQ
jgi:type IV secretion system protein VirB10